MHYIVEKYLDMPFNELVETTPNMLPFFKKYELGKYTNEETLVTLINRQPEKFWIESGVTPNILLQEFMELVQGIPIHSEPDNIHTLTIQSGYDKFGNKENCELQLKAGEVTCVVGPTGSGKSRLLADIEWLAKGDTPTRRKVLINGRMPTAEQTERLEGKLIAQITQNMNFVMDMSVEDFLKLHAESRQIDSIESAVQEAIDMANDLSGEQFNPTTPITFLSGGQSRALMISDVACIGQSPVVLIDEIENAGVNKKKALELLIQKDKIVLMATHDPLLILLADKRVVIKNGGMEKTIITTKAEKEYCSRLETLDRTLQATKDYFRKGKSLENPHQEII